RPLPRAQPQPAADTPPRAPGSHASLLRQTCRRGPTLEGSSMAQDDFRHCCILGLGQMGLTCAALLTAEPTPEGPRRPRVTLWGHDPDAAGALAQTRSSDHLPGF